MEVRGDGIYLRAGHRIPGSNDLPAAVAPEQRVLESEAADDPRPLYVIPWIPESEDEDLGALREKLRSQLLSQIGRSQLGELNFRFDDLLDEVSLGVYGLWRDRGSLRGQVNTTVGSIVSALTERIRTSDVPSAIPEGRQLPLEDTSAGGNLL